MWRIRMTTACGEHSGRPYFLSRLWRMASIGWRTVPGLGASGGRRLTAPSIARNFPTPGIHGPSSAASPNSATHRLIANSFECSIVVIVLIPGLRGISGEGDAQLLQNTSCGVVNVKGVETSEEGVRGLEVVLIRDTATGRRASDRVQLVFPPVEGIGSQAVPGLVRHCIVFYERRALIDSKDVGERGLEVVSLVIDHYFLVGQRKLRLWLLFVMATRPIFCRAIKRKCLCVHAFWTIAIRTYKHWALLNMYVTLTDVQNGETVYLVRSIGHPSVADAACRGLEIALYDVGGPTSGH